MSFNKLEKLRRAVFYPACQYVRICNGHSEVGEFKADYHKFICNAIYDYLFPSASPTEWLQDCRGTDIREATLDITDFLDEQIGLPLDRPLTARETKIFGNKFISKLFENLEMFREAVENEKSLDS